MFLNDKERREIARLVNQTRRDVVYMREQANDPASHITRGICERQSDMAAWLQRLLDHQPSEAH